MESTDTSSSAQTSAERDSRRLSSWRGSGALIIRIGFWGMQTRRAVNRSRLDQLQSLKLFTDYLHSQDGHIQSGWARARASYGYFHAAFRLSQTGALRLDWLLCQVGLRDMSSARTAFCEAARLRVQLPASIHVALRPHWSGAGRRDEDQLGSKASARRRLRC